MEVLITGIAGFIGSNLTERLVNENLEVIGIDKEINNRIPYLKDTEEIIFSGRLRLRDNFIFIYSDINDISNYHYMTDNIDRIYHLAASADILKSSRDTNCDLKDNAIGTHSILEMIRKKDIPELVFASSSAVYGEGPIPMTEDNYDLKPISLYGASKLAAEAFIIAYSKMYGLKATIFRFANVVGKNEHRGITPDFIKKLKDNPNELEILGDGNQTKSYFTVEDCMDALINLKPTKPVSIYNLGALDTIKVSKIADIIVDEMGLKNVKYKYTGGDRGWKGDVPRTIMSIEKALKAGWEPKYNCEESVRRTVKLLI